MQVQPRLGLGRGKRLGGVDDSRKGGESVAFRRERRDHPRDGRSGLAATLASFLLESRLSHPSGNARQRLANIWRKSPTYLRRVAASLLAAHFKPQQYRSSHRLHPPTLPRRRLRLWASSLHPRPAPCVSVHDRPAIPSRRRGPLAVVFVLGSTRSRWCSAVKRRGHLRTGWKPGGFYNNE
jgi:hypothetical protein